MVDFTQPIHRKSLHNRYNKRALFVAHSDKRWYTYYIASRDAPKN